MRRFAAWLKMRNSILKSEHNAPSNPANSRRAIPEFERSPDY